MTTTSLSSRAWARSVCGSMTRPCLSSSPSAAPENKNRTNARASALVRGSVFRRDSSTCHSDSGVGEQAVVQPPGDDEPLAQPFAEPGGDGQAAFVVQRVLKFAEEQRSQSPPL